MRAGKMSGSNYYCFDLGKPTVQADSTRVIETHRKQLLAPRLESWLGAIVEAPRLHDTRSQSPQRRPSVTARLKRRCQTCTPRMHRFRDSGAGAKLRDCPTILRRQARILLVARESLRARRQ